MDYSAPYPSRRPSVFGGDMVATSQPLAAQAGLSMLARGGNAMDAAIASAMALTVVEPTGNGLGSDGFAIVWDGSELHGLNASGRSPSGWTQDRFAGRTAMPLTGWDSITVPGAVSGWIALWRKFGSLPLEVLAEPAIRLARDGFNVTPMIATSWASGAIRLGGEPGFAETFIPGGHVPRAGERMRMPHHASSLEAIARTQGESFYRGALAERMIAHSTSLGGAMTLADLDAHRADWVGTISQAFGDHRIHEIPPNGQGIGTLIGLGILEALGLGDRPVDDVETVHLMIEATKLALTDLDAHVADIDHMRVTPADLLDPAYLAERARLVDRARAGDPGHGTPGRAGTVYLATADRSGRMVSWIQSNFMGFGSGVVVPGTGISLQDRGASFSLTQGHPNIVGPRKRPFQTIIPGFATDADGGARMAFGVMGGPMQAQGHLQMAVRILRYGQSPQAAADAPRWRVEAGRRVHVESSFDAGLAEALRERGHDIVRESPDAVFGFGGAQTILKVEGGYVGGSDPRKDGQAVAF